MSDKLREYGEVGSRHSSRAWPGSGPGPGRVTDIATSNVCDLLDAAEDGSAVFIQQLQLQERNNVSSRYTPVSRVSPEQADSASLLVAKVSVTMACASSAHFGSQGYLLCSSYPTSRALGRHSASAPTIGGNSAAPPAPASPDPVKSQSCFGLVPSRPTPTPPDDSRRSPTNLNNLAIKSSAKCAKWIKAAQSRHRHCFLSAHFTQLS